MNLKYFPHIVIYMLIYVLCWWLIPDHPITLHIQFGFFMLLLSVKSIFYKNKNKKQWLQQVCSHHIRIIIKKINKNTFLHCVKNHPQKCSAMFSFYSYVILKSSKIVCEPLKKWKIQMKLNKCFSYLVFGLIY